MRSSIIVLALACVLLFSAPALAQSSQDGASSAQYDQYDDPPVPGVGGQAVQDAIMASGAIRASAEEAQAADEGVVSAVERPYATDGRDLASTGAAEIQAETPSDLEKLPDTGGPSPWWLGGPLLCAGGLLARKILR